MSPAVSEILDSLRAAGSPVNIAGMARYGIRPARAYGVKAEVIRALARECRGEAGLASELWDTGVHEARALAALVADPRRITEAEVEKWVRQFDCWATCDSTCLHLLWKTPFAWRKVTQWAAAEPEYVRRAAFALLAALAVHDKKAAETQFRSGLALIRKAATDERNYVKKAVNWALRQIGKRDQSLRVLAIQTAEKLVASHSRSAKWIGADALRELRRHDL
ncbi:MAG: DNA alkylation repair protein [Bryobacteraceae bacterium]